MAPIEAGARVRLTRDTGAHRRGFEFVVEDYVEPASPRDREEGDIDAPHYYGSSAGGFNNVLVPADAVDLICSAAEMNARRAPTRAQVRNAIGISLLGDFDGFSTTETANDTEHSLEVYGSTDDGLPFGFRVSIQSVWETDL
jgi:hypothetical protein